MKFRKLGNTNVEVSTICLGTMTWGEQNTENEAHQQLSYAVEQGVNFIDTAELYAVPAKPQTYGLTEKYIGTWLKNFKNREKLIIASKIAGNLPMCQHIRGGSKFIASHFEEAIHGSLKRLQTDYIDLYQLHWPERSTNFFGQLGYKHSSDDPISDFKQILETLQSYIEQGKIRYIGISNETPWGLMQYLKYADKYKLPRIVSIQNPYSLVNRTFEIGLSEMAIREKVGLLAYSPLGGGLLTGKYQNNIKPKGSRYDLFPNYMARYGSENSIKATDEYIKLAKKHNLTPTELALAFVNQQNFLIANIIGATTMTQLKENINTINITLSDEVISEINIIHNQYPNVAP